MIYGLVWHGLDTRKVWTPKAEQGEVVIVYIKVNGIWKELFLSILNYCCVGDICMFSATTTIGHDCTD